MRVRAAFVLFAQVLLAASASHAEDVGKTDVYARIKAAVDAVSSINPHDHLRPFDQIPRAPEPEQALRQLWATSYFTWSHTLAPWPKSGSFDDWWNDTQRGFADARAASCYQYLLPAFRDLYGVDFDALAADEARKLSGRIYENSQSEEWLREVITERANVELMIVDPYWARLDFSTHYPFTVALCNVTSLVRGFHPSEFDNPAEDPYKFAEKHEMAIGSLDDYVAVLDRILLEAKKADAVCLKSTLAYNRTLRFENVAKDRAAAAFGRPRKELTPEAVRDFEDFVMWRLVELSAKHDLPFQIHTGHARIQGSNPMLLVDMIQANPKTKFILFHGGFPWIEETGLIAMRYRNVWIDSCWLPTLSYSIGKRAYQEWLEMIPSSRIMWGSDSGTAEAIYGSTEFTRRCLAEALAEMVLRGDLREADALRIGRQVMRENALEMFPGLRRRLWREGARRTTSAGPGDPVVKG